MLQLPCSESSPIDYFWLLTAAEHASDVNADHHLEEWVHLRDGSVVILSDDSWPGVREQEAVYFAETPGDLIAGRLEVALTSVSYHFLEVGAHLFSQLFHHPLAFLQRVFVMSLRFKVLPIAYKELKTLEWLAS